ncbi:unnamed protein product [Zymoseptoria tritici ST99CH_3D7]|uniref:Uncharacterized protein n=1 Tax=Zymoseptoria tritici (strain ST99CH_3D7) TaxID=1276538 RepID=A0A1X7RQK0_ZYMT9|nr:unnamed protein product [Zymoseptoria tritici ST99CH_3D7]
MPDRARKTYRDPDIREVIVPIPMCIELGCPNDAAKTQARFCQDHQCSADKCLRPAQKGPGGSDRCAKHMLVPDARELGDVLTTRSQDCATELVDIVSELFGFFAATLHLTDGRFGVGKRHSDVVEAWYCELGEGCDLTLYSGHYITCWASLFLA